MLHVRVMVSMVVAAAGAHLRLSKSIVLPLGIIDTEQSRKPMAPILLARIVYRPTRGGSVGVLPAVLQCCRAVFC